MRGGRWEDDEELSRLRATKWTYERREAERRWFLDPAFLGSGIVKEDCRVGDIIWLDRQVKGPAVFEPMGMRQMVEVLMKSALNLGKIFRPGLEAILALAREGRNFQLRASDPGAAWEKLRQHLT